MRADDGPSFLVENFEAGPRLIKQTYFPHATPALPLR